MVDANNCTLGDKCGAVFINRNFREWLKKKLGASTYAKIPMEKLMEGSRLGRDFEQAKIDFDGTGQEIYLALPREAGVEDDASRGIQDGELMMTALAPPRSRKPTLLTL